MEQLKKEIQKFNKDYLNGKNYKESYYLKLEMENFVKKNDLFCINLCYKNKKSNKSLTFDERKCYENCIRKIKEVDTVVNEFILERYLLWKYNSIFYEN